MPVEAYAVGINLVADAAKVTGPLDSIIQALRRVQEAQKNAQESMNSFVSSLSGARRVADSLASAMDRVAKSAAAAASASGRIKAMPGGGGGEGSISRSSNPSSAVAAAAAVASGSYSSPYSAAAMAGGPQRMLAPPPERLMLGYDPVERTAVRGSTVPMYGSSGPGVPVGGSYGPPPRRIGRDPLMLSYDPLPGATGAVLATIPGQGDSMGSGASFRGSVRPNGYTPNFTMTEDLSDLEEADRQRALEDAEYKRQARRGRRSAAMRRVRSGAAAVGRGVSAATPSLHGPNMVEMLGGYAAFEIMKNSFEDYGNVEQVYDLMQSDSALRDNPARMAAIRAGATGEMAQFRTLTPLDVAKNASEAYAISGGKMEEQPGIAKLLDRLEQNMILRGKSPQDAQGQAKAIVKALDISNRLYDPKTGQYSQAKAESEASRMQALLAVGGGFTTGQSILSFEKSAKLAGQKLDLVGEAEMAHFIEVDPRNAGSRLNSLENLFGGHAARMTGKDKAYWAGQGLYDKKGMLKDDDLLRTRPLEWIAKHMGGLSSSDIDDHTQRMNVSAIAQETTGANGNIMRQAAATVRSNADANSGTLLASPKGTVSMFEASVSRFMATLGRFEAGPGVAILGKLTDALDRMTTYMNAHPKDVQSFMDKMGAMVIGIVGLAEKLASGWAAIPAPLKMILLAGTAGAAVGGKMGGVTGAAVGAGLGVAGALAHTAGQQQAADGMAYTYGGLGGAPLHDYSGGARIQKQSYEVPIENHTHVYIDGDKVSHSVERRMASRASRPSAYSNTPDVMEVAPRPGSQPVSF